MTFRTGMCTPVGTDLPGLQPSSSSSQCPCYRKTVGTWGWPLCLLVLTQIFTAVVFADTVSGWRRNARHPLFVGVVAYKRIVFCSQFSSGGGGGFFMVFFFFFACEDYAGRLDESSLACIVVVF